MKFEKENIKNIKRAGAVFLTLSLIWGGLKCADKILRNDYSYKKYKPFFENKTDYDVFFYGNSHVIDGIFPMQLWNDYGITSYNLSSHSSHIPTTYGTLKLSLKYKKPKIAVLDVSYGDRRKNSTKADFAHKAYDAFPLSLTKIMVVNEVFKESAFEDGDVNRPNIPELLNPFSLYHSRWGDKDIKFESLFDSSCNEEMGAESRSAVSVPDKFTLLNKNYVPEKDY